MFAFLRKCRTPPREGSRGQPPLGLKAPREADFLALGPSVLEARAQSTVAMVFQSAGPRCGLHIADERLASLVDVDMLDTNELRAAVPQAPQRFDLGCVGAQQPGRCRRFRDYVSLGAATTELSKYSHRCRMGCSLHREPCGARFPAVMLVLGYDGTVQSSRTADEERRLAAREEALTALTTWVRCGVRSNEFELWGRPAGSLKFQHVPAPAIDGLEIDFEGRTAGGKGLPRLYNLRMRRASASAVDPIRTGGPGRPTPMHLVEVEGRRRIRGRRGRGATEGTLEVFGRFGNLVGSETYDATAARCHRR